MNKGEFLQNTSTQLSFRKWRSPEELTPGTIPTAVAPWILENNSMTKRVQNAAPTEFEFSIKQQGWGRMYKDEALYIQAEFNTRAYVRDVLLQSQDKVWVYGRSVLPHTTLEGMGKEFLLKIQTRPLGEVLFGEYETYRNSLKVAKLTKQDCGYVMAQEMLPAADEYWARRSLLFLYDKPIIITDIVHIAS